MTAATDSNDYSGYVYVATNPAMPDMVKVGSTTLNDPQSRITSLFTTSVPVPFELEYAAAIEDDPRRVERALHRAFAPQRVHPKREFFKIEPEQAIAILELLDAADITEQAKAEVEAEKSQDDRRASEAITRRPRLNFSQLGLPAGSILTFVEDEEVRIEVIDNWRVKLTGFPGDRYPTDILDQEPAHLSPLTAALLGKSYNVPPTPYWRTAEGRSLGDVYLETYGPPG